MKNASIIFVGSMNLGHKPDDGETMKNFILSKALAQYVHKVIRIDVRNRPQRIYYLAKFVWCLFAKRNARLIFSSSSFVTYRLLRIVKKIGWRGNSIYYWVIGGNFGNHIVNKEIPSSLYYDLKQIIVEGDAMKNQLLGAGFNNVRVIPNMKEIDYIPKKVHNHSGITRFVFLSRVMPEKGVNYIVDASRLLIAKGLNNFIVDLYGSISPQYKEKLAEASKSIPNVNYKGFLMLDCQEGYDILASYDVMLFPTYWHGEGFPGVLIDAFISGLPVIATDWNLNTSLVHDSENGMIIPVHDVNALEVAMEKVVKGTVDVKAMSEHVQKEASHYDVDNVITPNLLKELNIL